MSLKFFGTDGIRGAYGGDALNDDIAYRAGVAAARVAQERLGVERPSILVGRDTRASGAALFRAFAAGALSAGGEARDLGVAPTPCVAFAARTNGAHLACAITASHNPAADNGLKFFQGNGVKLSEELEQALDDAIGRTSAGQWGGEGGSSIGAESGQVDAYLQSIVDRFPNDLLRGKRVALDCANGALHALAPRLFESLGATVMAVGTHPDGANINAGVGSEHPNSLRSLFADAAFDLGFAFDGDGDRVILFDESGERVSGEALLAALALDAAARGELYESTLVTTVQSNLGLDALLKARGCRVLRTDVGDKHIVRLMATQGYSVGGEESGHVVLREFALTGDGLTASARLAAIMTLSGRTVSEVVEEYVAFPHASQALKLSSKPPLASCRSLMEAVARWEETLQGEGRLLVRYSGTEPKLRLLVEARREDMVAQAMADLRAAAQVDLEIV